jgi:Fe-S cluster assembly protein SufD
VPDPFETTLRNDDADWAQHLRVEAAALAADMSVPSGSEEAWRFTDVARLPFDAGLRLASFETAAMPDVAAIGRLVAPIGRRCALVVSSPAGVQVVEEPTDGVAVRVLGTDPDAVSGDVVAADEDLTTALNAAHFDGGVRVVVDAGAVVDAPVVVVHWCDAPSTAFFPRCRIDVGRGAVVDVVEVWASTADATGSFVVPVVETDVADGAVVRHAMLQCCADDVAVAGVARARVGRDASVTSAVAALGGSVHRMRVELDCVGEGAEALAYGVYVGDGDRHIDFRTRQQHSSPRSTSRLLYRGAVWDVASSIVSGLVRIEADAAGCDAQQASHYLILSDAARAANVPNLEILNPEVSCGHAASGGPPDADQLYYLAARGIDPKTARRLVVDGFFADVIGRFPLDGVRAIVSDGVFSRLERLREGSAAT